MRNSNNELNKSKAALNDLYEKLLDNYNQVNEKCNRLDTMYKELERKSQDTANHTGFPNIVFDIRFEYLPE